ncbi:hypothetical protein RB195_020067 [Necator americanus]|uniref:Uncharacterized protein n=1 Tax=Necator americanus TaxID=51031 RepID=A0ABR1CJ87_NECAM
MTSRLTDISSNCFILPDKSDVPIYPLPRNERLGWHKGGFELPKDHVATTAKPLTEYAMGSLEEKKKSKKVLLSPPSSRLAQGFQWTCVPPKLFLPYKVQVFHDQSNIMRALKMAKKQKRQASNDSFRKFRRHCPCSTVFESRHVETKFLIDFLAEKLAVV